MIVVRQTCIDAVSQCFITLDHFAFDVQVNEASLVIATCCYQYT